MSKGLEALEHLYAKLSCKSSIENIHENLQEYDIIEKELKALEIIKEKKVSCLYIVVCKNVEEYNNIVPIEKDELTKKEYDLLKEILL